RQRDRKARALGDTQELRGANLAAQRMCPLEVTDPRDDTSGAQVMTPYVTNADLLVLDGVAQLPSHVQAREGAQFDGVAEKENLGGGCTARFGRRGPGVIEQQPRR